MIVKRKLFTRADKKVVHELWSATKGFRTLPAGYENLTPRDLWRINNFTKGFNKMWTKGKMGAIDWGEFSTVANHMNLPETAKGAQHLVEKYSNPELLERYRSIKAHRLGLGNEYKTLNEKPKEALRLVQISKTRDLTPNELNKLQTLTDQIRESKQKLNQIDRQEGKADDTPITNIITHMMGIFGKNREQPAQTIPKLQRFKNKQSKLHKAAIESYKNNTETDDALYNKLLVEAKKHNKVIIDNGKNNAAQLGTNKIYITNARDSILAHELGHHQVFRRMGNKKSVRRYQLENGAVLENNASPFPLMPIPLLGLTRVKNPMYHLSEELKASYQALATLKKIGAPPEEIARARKQLEDAYRTYYHHELGNVPNRIGKRTRFIDHDN